MTDRSIIFSGPMIRALLDGRKTQTRRVLKPQPKSSDFRGILSDESVALFGAALISNCEHISLPYAPDDRLWVREAWRTSPAYDDLKPSEMGGDESICYAADGAWESWGWGNTGCVEGGRPRSSIHMPRWASRLTLTVTDVRAQRVQEISYLDTCAEGVDCETCTAIGQSACYRKGCGASRQAFASLWDSINAKLGFGWDANPWVVALTFTVHHRNIDQMEEVPA